MSSEEDDPPRRRRNDDDEPDDRPRRRSERSSDDDEDRPRRGRPDGDWGDEEDDRERRARRSERKEQSADFGAGEWLLAILCSGIGCIVGIVWLIQGNPKGGKMLGISLLFVVIWNIVRFGLVAMQQQ